MEPVLTLALPRMIMPEYLTRGAPIVVLAPHPDDESLGCGALLTHAFAQRGAHVICMTDGSASHPGSTEWPPARLANARRFELERAVACLGGTPSDITWLGHPDGWLGAQDRKAVAAGTAQICRDLGARHLFAPAVQDHHEDHRSTARIAHIVATTVLGLVQFAYPVWSRHDDPDLLARVSHLGPVALDTCNARSAKRAAIAAHATQLGLIVRDDPAGFALSAAFVDAFVDGPEFYWKVPS